MRVAPRMTASALPRLFFEALDRKKSMANRLFAKDGVKGGYIPIYLQSNRQPAPEAHRSQFTVRETVVDCVIVPEVPVTVMV